MLINPLFPFTFFKINSLKATILLLFILLFKSNLLRLKGGLIGGLVALTLISGLVLSSTVAAGSIIYAINLKKKAKKDDDIEVDDQLEAVNI